MSITPPMWKALTFLATHERWVGDKHHDIVRPVTIVALTRREFADRYDNGSEAWITPVGVQYIISNISEILIEYSVPGVAPGKWEIGDRLRRGLAGSRLQIQAQCQLVSERIRDYHHGKQVVLVRPTFKALGE
jgi:hypothetical protein